MPTLRLISLIFYGNILVAEKGVKIPLIDSIYLNILQVLKLKFAKIDKRRVQIISGGWKNFQKLISGGGDVY